MKERANNVGGRNPYYQNVVGKYGKDNVLISTFECSSEDAAFDLEIGLIKCFKRNGIKLTNLTDGGEGLSNPSDEVKRKISIAQTGKRASLETRKRMSTARIGKSIKNQVRKPE